MYLRIFSITGGALLLASCGGTLSEEPEGAMVECAIGPGAELSQVCTLELISEQEFLIHHPDGGFRRFVHSDGANVLVADGADPVTDERSEDGGVTLEFTLQSDRYRLASALLTPSRDE